MCAQRRLKSTCASAQSDFSLRGPHKETLHPWLFRMRPVNIFIGLHKCTFLDIEARIIFESAPDQTYNTTCVTSKDSDQHVYLPGIAMVLVNPILDSLEAVEGTCDQRRRRWDCTDVQADLSHRSSHKPYCRFCRALTHFRLNGMKY